MLLFGHVMRANGMEKDMMLACGEGRRKRDRMPTRKRWMKEKHTVGDETGGAEGCDGGSGLVATTDHGDR